MINYLSCCTRWYYNDEGQSGQGKGFFEDQYGERVVQFYALLAKWREEGQLEEVVIE